jgi:hypothetical protein
MIGKLSAKFNLTRSRHRDAGMAFTLLMLLAGLYSDQRMYFVIGAISLFSAMTLPELFYPFSLLWYALSELMGWVMTKVILTLLFVFLVIPVGVVRRISGRDPMRRRAFRESESSVFLIVDKEFGSKDIIHPY